MKEENPPLKNSDNSPIENLNEETNNTSIDNEYSKWVDNQGDEVKNVFGFNSSCLLYTSPSPRDLRLSRMPSSA